jgi:hypothetical protein
MIGACGRRSTCRALEGPVDGRSLLVPVDEDGVPPDVIDQTWLWVEFRGELLDADMAGVYEPEPAAGTGPPWIYVWAPGVAVRTG